MNNEPIANSGNILYFEVDKTAPIIFGEGFKIGYEDGKWTSRKMTQEENNDYEDKIRKAWGMNDRPKS